MSVSHFPHALLDQGKGSRGVQVPWHFVYHHLVAYNAFALFGMFKINFSNTSDPMSAQTSFNRCSNTSCTFLGLLRRVFVSRYCLWSSAFSTHETCSMGFISRELGGYSIVFILLFSNHTFVTFAVYIAPLSCWNISVSRINNWTRRSAQWKELRVSCHDQIRHNVGSIESKQTPLRRDGFYLAYQKKKSSVDFNALIGLHRSWRRSFQMWREKLVDRWKDPYRKYVWVLFGTSHVFPNPVRLNFMATFAKNNPNRNTSTSAMRAHQ